MDPRCHRRAVVGFTIVPHLLPSSVTDIVDKRVPDLQSRGVHRTEYSGNTLRATTWNCRRAGRLSGGKAAGRRRHSIGRRPCSGPSLPAGDQEPPRSRGIFWPVSIATGSRFSVGGSGQVARSV
ncbi:hypothetical protein CTZ28_34880 [Streptomyces shenzhenensis]|uniref:Uncharacterized protein n=1 Tax=Streptomyces shenzhenensis TaxID=943815 RepID=A0A3M0HWJ3_9ACTN|nr:hypothetical protein CTZ28_34880 [Streptomyces shenzhenensis]